ncbi:MAG: phosphonate ABC transporter ATP-binding protein [Cyanobacteria bacterium J06642_12]
MNDCSPLMKRPLGDVIRSVNVVGVSKVYPNGTRALDSVNVVARSGEGLVLLGHNGSGKSTLLRCIVGLEPVTSGEVVVGGQTVTALTKSELRTVRSRIGVVFQHFHLVSSLTAFHSVLHGAMGRNRHPRNWFPATAEQSERVKAMACLERVGIAEFANQRVDTLSGGQRQRVAIARMLMQEPDIVLADEPIASLDPLAGREIMDLLWDIVRERQLTLICTLHQLDLAKEYASRIVGLSGGKVLFDRPPERLSTAEIDRLYRKAPEPESLSPARASV